MDKARVFQLRVDLPFMKVGNLYSFDDEIGWVYRCNDDGSRWEYPLREGLRGYLWLLKSENDTYLKEV
jgi:hypothetical protein